MKPVRFVREQNTYNEYTCDQFTDCTGDYYRKDDVIDEVVKCMLVHGDSDPDVIAALDTLLETFKGTKK